MSIDITWPLGAADPSNFTGTVFNRLVAAAERDAPIKLYYVHFEPGARTNWHTHSGPQILVVTSGRCRFQREGEPPREIVAGESVRFEPGIRHWHGAAFATAAEHIAINLDARETLWREPVSEADYREG
jgi:quercetin dioxygenase-like cupin family protein